MKTIYLAGGCFWGVQKYFDQFDGEALLTLDRFMDSMLLSGIDEFTVIHGKGTGALRTAVQQHLRGNKYVKSYRLGTFGEGENGVTIVTLK